MARQWRGKRSKSSERSYSLVEMTYDTE